AASRPSLPLPDTAPRKLHTLSLHDALPISGTDGAALGPKRRSGHRGRGLGIAPHGDTPGQPGGPPRTDRIAHGSGHQGGVLCPRSEEHTSELQSRFDLVCRLLLEKKKESKT